MVVNLSSPNRKPNEWAAVTITLMREAKILILGDLSVTHESSTAQAMSQY